MRALVVSSLLLLISSGPALAGRGGGGSRGGGGGGHTRVVVHGGGGGGGVRVVGRAPVVRVNAPVVRVRERYYDHTRRPVLIVENYGRRPGYYWVNGEWQWDGREWIWYAGRYEPDPNYIPGPVYRGGY